MSYVYHHAILVTGSIGDNLTEIHKRISKAVSLNVSPIMESLIDTKLGRDNVNGYGTFMVVPDGSKEGWDASAQGDKERLVVLEILDDSGLDWVEVQYGHDDYGAPYHRLPHVTRAALPGDSD